MATSFNWLLKAASVTAYNMGTIPGRKGSSAESIFGIAGVVAVFVGVLSIAVGFRKAMTNSTSPDVAMVMRSGADTEMMSILFRDQARIIGDAPRLRTWLLFPEPGIPRVSLLSASPSKANADGAPSGNSSRDGNGALISLSSNDARLSLTVIGNPLAQR